MTVSYTRQDGSLASIDTLNSPAKSKNVSAPLTPGQIKIVKSTAPLLKKHGEEITMLFYKNMLAAHPELQNIFNRTSQATGSQPRALANAVFAYATYIDDLEKLTEAVRRITTKHASLIVKPEQYDIVGKYLIEAVATVLGDAVTTEVAEAWTVAYAELARILINAEKNIHSEWGNWTNWRRFRIQKKIAESSEVTSFLLVPEDGQKLPIFKPGQYVSLRIFVPEFGCLQPRQYSLSEAPDSNVYRISVKRDVGKQIDMPGTISNILHDSYCEGDVVELTHPTGTFYVDPKKNSSAPLILISAGVGATPMISILNGSVGARSTRSISWVHGAHSSGTHAFAKHVHDACVAHDNIQAKIFMSKPHGDEVEGIDYHFEGRMNLDRLHKEEILFLHDHTAQYYICGPSDFMQEIKTYLLSAGVDRERVHMEVFGVGSDE